MLNVYINSDQFNAGGKFYGIPANKVCLVFGMFTGHKWFNTSGKFRSSEVLRVDLGGVSIEDEVLDTCPKAERERMTKLVQDAIIVVAKDGVPLTPDELLHFGYDNIKIQV